MLLLLAGAGGAVWMVRHKAALEAQAARQAAEDEIAAFVARARDAAAGGRQSDAVTVLRGAMALETALGIGGEDTVAVALLRRLASTGFSRRTIDVGASIEDVAVHGNVVSVGDAEGRLRWFDLEDGRTTLDRPVCHGRWYSVDFARDGRLARGCREGRIEVRRPDGSLEADLRCGQAPVESVRWHPLGLRVVAGDGRFCAWGDVRSEPRVFELGHGVDVVAYNADSSRMVAAALPREPSWAGLSVLDLDVNEVLRRLPNPKGTVRGLALDGPGERVIVRTQDRKSVV